MKSKPSKFVGDPTFRKFVGEKKTHYIPIETINAADNIQVDGRDPNSGGYGGTTFEIKTTEGVDIVKGPWHGTVPYEVCDVTELHFTKVLIVANTVRIPWNERKDYHPESLPYLHGIEGDILYQEKEMVLGTFHRGDRIAQQLANLRQETIFVHVDTSGGSHSHECKPGDKLHPRATRGPKRFDVLSTEQGMIVSG